MDIDPKGWLILFVLGGIVLVIIAWLAIPSSDPNERPGDRLPTFETQR